NGIFCQGFNPLASVSNKKKVSDALAKLKYMVVMDPLATDTSEFWKNFGEFNEVDPAKIPTEVFRLPTTLFAETSGSFTNSGRVIQWRWKAVDGPGDSKDDTEIMASLFLRLKEMYAKDGGAFFEPIQKLTWAYRIANKPSPEELMMEYNGKALGDVLDPKDPTKVLVKA
ncbi:MAG: formate dehydrogenase, partial [Deltaproteobacteria bacterium]|nr:formate dehydrogenase [Deltaproteobacteria bacterium]